MDNDPLLSQMRVLSHRRLRLIWETAQRDNSLEGEDAQLADIMRQHTEWHHLWAHIDELSDAAVEEGGVNPIVHILMHQVVLNQINGVLPPARTTYDALIASGLDWHEAIHRIAAVFSEEFWAVVKFKKLFDEAKYLRHLKELVKPQPLHRSTGRSRRK